MKKQQFIIFICPLVTLIILLSVVLKNVSQIGALKLEENAKKLRKIIIDTDAGADDAFAILLALKYEASHRDDIQIIAITCTYGNTVTENVETNVLKTLTIANRSDIPVYGGAKSPLIIYWEDTHYFGHDGLGDFDFKDKIIASVDRSKHASLALIDLIKANSGEISIIALGPLTNIALAIKLDPTFVNHVKEFYITGSTVSGIGNIKPNVEFNFGTDPESDFIVFNSTFRPHILMPWEIVYSSPITAEWRKNVFGVLKSQAVEFLNQAEAIVQKEKNSWIAIDPMIIATFCWPNLIKNSFETNITPVIDGAAKGSILVDYLNITAKAPNAKVIKLFDVQLYKEKLIEYFEV